MVNTTTQWSINWEWWKEDKIIDTGNNGLAIQLGMVDATVIISMVVYYTGYLIHKITRSAKPSGQGSENRNKCGRIYGFIWYLLFSLGLNYCTLVMLYTFINQVIASDNPTKYIFIHNPYWGILFFYQLFFAPTFTCGMLHINFITDLAYYFPCILHLLFVYNYISYIFSIIQLLMGISVLIDTFRMITLVALIGNLWEVDVVYTENVYTYVFGFWGITLVTLGFVYVYYKCNEFLEERNKSVGSIISKDNEVVNAVNNGGFRIKDKVIQYYNYCKCCARSVDECKANNNQVTGNGGVEITTYQSSSDILNLSSSDTLSHNEVKSSSSTIDVVGDTRDNDGYNGRNLSRSCRYILDWYHHRYNLF